MSLQDEFQNRIQEVKQRFVSRLGEQALDFRALQKQLRDSRYSGVALGELRIGVHKIRGVAPTFGLAALGDKADAVEQMINAILAKQAGPDTKQRLDTSIDALLLEMGAIFVKDRALAKTDQA